MDILSKLPLFELDSKVALTRSVFTPITTALTCNIMTYIFALNTCTMKLKVNFIIKFSMMLNVILFVQYNIYETSKYRCKFIKTLKAVMPSVILFWNYIQMHRCKINNVMNMYLNMYLCQYMIVIIITVDFLHIIMAIICISFQRIERN